MRNADAHLNLTLDGRHLAGALRAAAGDAGTFDVHDVDLHVGGGGALDVNAWRAAWGKVGITANLDLGRLAAILPAGALGLTDLAGRVTLDGRHRARLAGGQDAWGASLARDERPQRDGAIAPLPCASRVAQ